MNPVKILLLAFLGLSSLSVQAQFFFPKKADVAAGVFWQYTNTLASDGQVGGGGINNQFTTNPVGVVLQARYRKNTLVGFEGNYSFTHPTESYSYYKAGVVNGLDVPTAMHEFTLAYMIQPNIFFVHPFVTVGGGIVGFIPDATGAAMQSNNSGVQPQWRGAGVAEVGLNIPWGFHFGVRPQVRLVGTRGPNFHDLIISTDSWVLSTEPTVSAYFKF